MFEVRPSGDGARWPGVVAWLLAAAGLVLALLLALARPERGTWGDEGVYLAMTASLVRDGDLAFGSEDREWARAQEPPVTVILQRIGSDVSYSKPVLYPLLAAPFYALAGGRGLVVLNLLATAGALVLAWRFLRRLGELGAAALTLASFALCGVLPFYLGWRMSDSVLAAMVLAGLVLAVGRRRVDTEVDRYRWGQARSDGWRRAAVGGLLLGLVTSMRFPGAALAGAAVLAAWVAGHRRRAAAIALGALLGFGAASLAGVALTGTANPYKAERAGFSGATGYPGESEAAERFDTHPATQSATWVPRVAWSRTGYSSLYAWIGRHTGLVWYFPAAIALLATALRWPRAAGLALLTGPAAAAVFYLVWMPENYFGGSTFVGNRYFLMAYPALLVALPRLPPARWLAVGWLLALLAGGSALVSIRGAVGDPSSQSHAAAGLFRLLPNESTAQKVDGFRHRFWSRDFVRFTDRYARVGEESFVLASGRPAAELELAFRLPRDTLRLEATTSTPGVRLRYRDWRGSGEIELGAGVQEIALPLSPAWRWHTYWWQAPDRYQVRTLRLAVEHPAGEPAQVELRSLGGPLPAAR